MDRERRKLEIDLPLAYWNLLEGCVISGRKHDLGELVSCILQDYLEPLADVCLETYEDLKVIRNGSKK